MTHNESIDNHKTLFFTKELFYLAVGCGLILAMNWFKRVWSERITENVAAVSN